VFGVATKIEDGAVSVEYKQCVSHASYDHKPERNDIAYFIYACLTSFTLPFLTIVGSYGLILCVLKRKSNAAPSDTANGGVMATCKFL
jgi:hypothetical protein